jgi:hypothetical protein
MTMLHQAQLRELIEHQASPCVSMFLPTNPGSREQRQDAIRLKNLRTAALEQLIERGLRRPQAESLLEPTAQLLEGTAGERTRGDSLAAFVSEGFMRSYAVPLELSEQLVVNERFFVKPLLPLLHSDGRYYALTLGKSDVRLFESTRDSIRELQLPEIERAPLDGPKETLQYHAHQAPSMGRGGTKEAMFHGQGGPEDREKVDMLNFFHRVNDAVQQVLHDDRAPLVLVCVGYLAPIYESANSYSGLLDEHASGSPEHWSDEEIRQRTWKVVEPRFARAQEQALGAWGQLQGQGLASANLGEVVLAANAGRVDKLLLRPQATQWGRVDVAKQSVESLAGPQEGAEELLDYAAACTLGAGGEVYTVEAIPGTDSPIAATFRY